jgi:hypothetical protein
MGRFNQSGGHRGQPNMREAAKQERRESLIARGWTGPLDRRGQIAEAERALGLVWRGGGFGDEVRGHALAKARGGEGGGA